jgi:hypothetical protein
MATASFPVAFGSTARRPSLGKASAKLLFSILHERFFDQLF